MRSFYLHRWLLLAADLIVLLLIIVAGQWLFAFEMGKRITVMMLLALAGSWMMAYRDRGFNLDYYTYLVKIWVWTNIFCLLYVGLLKQFDFILPVIAYLFSWLVIAALFRAIYHSQSPKYRLLIYADSGENLPKHPKIEYCFCEDLKTVSLKQYHAVLIDDKRVYPRALHELVAHAQASGIPVITYARLIERVSGRVSIDDLKHTWIDNSFSVSWGYMQFKRVCESLMIVLLLPLWLPVGLVISLAILLTMGWPVFFVQPRVGQYGKIFNIYKFRTMRQVPEVTAETSVNDPRITGLGKFLRKTRLDEWPQFINVLKGNMDLIGPRPEWQFTAEKYSHEIPAYHIRHLVKPGMTGWAQINQGHVTGTTENITKLQYDIYYVKNFSFWLDIKICVKTIGILLTGFGAK